MSAIFVFRLDGLLADEREIINQGLSKGTMKILFTFLLLCASAMAQTNTFCPQNGNCSYTGNSTWAGSSTFNGATTLPNVSSLTDVGTLAVTGLSTLSGGVSNGASDQIKGPNPWYDITAWGAKCDGATDDTAAIQAALTAANTAHGGKVFVPMGTNACVVATNLVMDDFLNVTLIGASQGSPAGATPRGWIKFTGTTTPLISCKSCNGTTIKGLYLQYTNAGFTGTFVEYGHSASAKDATGNRFEDNFVGKTLTGGSAAVLLSWDQAIDNFAENNQFNDAAVAIRGRNAPAGAGTDYAVNNMIRNNSFGQAGSATISTAYLQNIGLSSTVIGNDFEIGSGAISILAFTGAMQSSGTFAANFVGDMTGTNTMTLFTIPANGAWSFTGGNVIAPVSVNVTGFSVGNNATLTVEGNFMAGGSTFGTLFTIGTGVVLHVDTNTYGAVSTFLTGTPAGGAVMDNTNHMRLPVGTCGIPGIAFAQNNAIGWTIGQSNHLQVGYNGCGPMFSNQQLGIGSAMALISTPGTDPEANAADTSLSRDSAGVWAMGTGAAGNAAGSLKLTKEQLVEAAAPSGVAGQQIIFGDSGDHMLKYNPNNAGEQHVPQIYRLTAQYTNSTTGFTTVGTPNIAFPVNASQSYTAECHLYYQAAATGGLNIQFTGPASPMAVIYGLTEPVSATAFAGDSVATAFSTSLGNAVTTASTNFDAEVSFSLINGANAGTVTLQAKSSAAVQLQIQAGSYCRVQ